MGEYNNQNFRKVAENIFEITRKHSNLEHRYSAYQALVQKKRKACDMVGVSFEQELGQEIIRLAYEFENVYDESKDDYLFEILKYATEELTKWLKDR